MRSNREIEFLLIHGSDVFYERSKGDVITSIDKGDLMIRKVFEGFKAFAKKFVADMKVTIRRLALPAKLRTMKKAFENQKDKGYKFVSIPDYKKFEGFYKNEAKNILHKMKKLDYRRYKSREKLERFFDEIDECINDYEKEIEYILNNPIKVSIDDAISFVDNEINGRSGLWKEYLRVCNDLEVMMIEYNKIYNVSKSATGDFLKSNYRNKVQRFGANLAKAMRNGASKFTRTAVFLFA